jgi:phosphoribosylaminoimidazole carboxylase (NCAIR synthetase)
MTIAPGSTIGIVGGGQLGRMLAIAAARLGYKCHIFDPHEHPCAADVAATFTRAPFDDRAALEAFGAAVDVATYEFENLAAGPLEDLSSGFGAVLEPGELDRARKLLEGLGPLPIVPEHRDCSPWNVLIAPAGSPALSQP